MTIPPLTKDNGKIRLSCFPKKKEKQRKENHKNPLDSSVGYFWPERLHPATPPPGTLFYHPKHFQC
jgi:hypothetical protein